MTDNRVRDRVKGLLAATALGNEAAEHPGTTHRGGGPEHPAPPPGGELPQHALQVLTLAQRTADEHVASAKQQAAKIRVDAQAAAEQTARSAEIHAHEVRQEADKVLTDARSAAERMARDARARAQETQREADMVLSDAQSRAEAIAADARAKADELKLQAEQRYQDVVGSLASRREALQQQIESLENFDREYRARLTRFMQNQLRALWVDQPEVAGETGEPAAGPVPPHRAAHEAEPDDSAKADPEH